MPKSENQKLKTLYVAKFFLENSDENHAITASDIVDYLREECSIEAERRSIYRDIAILRDEFGMDIDGGQGGRYRLLSRQFEFDDLRILAECVHAARFISASKAKELVSTIGELGSMYQAESLQHEVFLIDRVKSTQKGTLNIISTINAAMAKKQDGKPHEPQKISFKYMKHSTGQPRRGQDHLCAAPCRCLYHWRDASGHEAHTAVSSDLSDRRGRFGRYRQTPLDRSRRRP